MGWLLAGLELERAGTASSCRRRRPRDSPPAEAYAARLRAEDGVRCSTVAELPS